MNDDIKKIIRNALSNNRFKQKYSYSFSDFIDELDKKLNIEIKGE